MARFGVGVMHNTINSRFGPKPLVHADYAIGLACRADSFWVADHLNSVLPPSMWTPKHVGAARLIPKMDAHLEPWTMLGYLAGRNRLGRMRLGVAVTDTGRRNPAVTAQAAASLHLLTRGRAVLGIGTGERESNAPYGVDWSKPVARFEEAVATIRALWNSNGELVTRDSPFFPLHKATFALPPYRGNWPQIWIAAHGPRMMRATGRYADGWFPGTTRAIEYGEQLEIVRTAAADAGRDPMAITPAKDWARHGAQHPLGADFTGVQDLIPQTIDEQTALGYAAKAPRSLVEELFAVGTPDEVVDQMAEFRDHGLRYLVVGNAGAIQPSLRKSVTATAPYVKVVRALKKL
jgi:phthiodiolone/phenolphthiodiolone dimycocerosates ketoreductase